MRRFEGRVALVSGSAQGMGKAVALRLGEEGATVVRVGQAIFGARAQPDSFYWPAGGPDPAAQALP